jgi:glucose/arabinose dehydrogenase
MTFYTGDRIPEWKGNVLVGGLSGLAVHRVGFNEKGGLMGREELIRPMRQRIRDIRQGPDGLLYVAIDANPGGILRIEPAQTPTTASR